MATRYVVSIYRPGYLSEGEPYTTTNLDDAIKVWESEIAETIDSIADDEAYIDEHTALHVTDLDATAREELAKYFQAIYYVDGYAHEILAVAD